MTDFNYRRQIRSEYEERRSRNGSYSLRAYARDLTISSTALHGVLSGERHLSSINLDKVADKLGWSPVEVVSAKFDIEGKKIQPSAEEIFDHDRFRLIADWFYLGILNLAMLKKQRSDSRWIAKRLGLPVDVIKEAMTRLQRLKLIEKSAGKLKRLIGNIGTVEDVPSSALKTYHRQCLRNASEKLDSVDGDMREFLSITLPVETSDLPRFKKMIREFREEFVASAKSKKGDEVYQLNLQLFPITEVKSD